MDVLLFCCRCKTYKLLMEILCFLVMEVGIQLRGFCFCCETLFEHFKQGIRCVVGGLEESQS
jgi:hypothetical protein